MQKLFTYSAASLFAVSILIGNAAYSHQQFYPTVVSLTTSKVSRVMLFNAAFVLLVLLGRFTCWLFLGKLRPREVEKALEQTFYYVATTCLALTIFREHMTSTIGALFVLCLSIKILHWLVQSRQEYIEQTLTGEDGGQWGEYLRLFTLLVLLGIVDVTTSMSFIAKLLRTGPSVRLLLALEYLVMSVTCTTTFIRLSLHIVDDRNQHRWENKGKYKFYLEIFSDLLQCILYMGFFVIILWFYGIPIHLVRELFITLRSFKKTISDFLRYRKLVACLDERYPNATAEEIARDPQCIICYDDMAEEAKKLPCGHIFHKHCLKSWMERNNKCPYCNKQTLLDTPAAPMLHRDPDQQPQATPTLPTVPISQIDQDKQLIQPRQSEQPQAPILRKRTKASSKKGKEQSGSQCKQKLAGQQQQQQMLQFFNTWQQQMGQPQATMPYSAASSSPTPAPVAPQEVGSFPSSPSPVAVMAAPNPGLYQYYTSFYGAGQGPTSDASGVGSAAECLTAVPGNSTQAQAYAEFHKEMAKIYANMSATVQGIAEAYTQLALNLQKHENASTGAAAASHASNPEASPASNPNSVPTGEEDSPIVDVVAVDNQSL
jgi:E3 ubiquitin-protein ligase synoviolin